MGDHGRPMEDPWQTHRRPMASSWTHGGPATCPWKTHEDPQETHGRPIGGPWETHGNNMGVPWETYMGQTSDPMGRPW